MTRRRLSIAISGSALAFFTWGILAISLGNVGLQQTVSLGPQILLTQHLPTVVVVFAVGVLWAATTGLAMRHTRRDLAALLGVVLLVDAIASFLIAPAVVGELTVLSGPTVFVVLSALGIQPLAVVVGGLGAVRWLRIESR